MKQEEFNVAIEADSILVRFADAVKKTGLTENASREVLVTVLIMSLVTVGIVSWNLHLQEKDGFIVDPDLFINYQGE